MKYVLAVLAMCLYLAGCQVVVTIGNPKATDELKITAEEERQEKPKPKK